jgi:hypothetical protein
MGATQSGGAGRRWPFIATLVIGIGLALAPVGFQMFSRAPKGGDMITAFRPYMTAKKIGSFQGYMTTMDGAVSEAKTGVNRRLGISAAEIAKQYPSYADFVTKWPAINHDMGDMLTTMRGDIPDFQAVDALPPFPLFPWFFVIPGVLIAGASIWALRTKSRRRGTTIALIVLGVGLIAAPIVFQMFTRAPKGGRMIDDFRPLMTNGKILKIQGYFLVLGAGEGTLRVQVLPAYRTATGTSVTDTASALPAVQHFEQQWDEISSQMAPMIGAMVDNLGHYQAVDALPPFPLFPWFFAIPGVLITGLAYFGGRGARRSPTPDASATTN